MLGFLRFPDISLPEWVRCTRRDQRRTKLWEILFMEYLRQGLLCSLGWFRTHSADEASVQLSSASQALGLHTRTITPGCPVDVLNTSREWPSLRSLGWKSGSRQWGQEKLCQLLV